jgi:type IX secretion system PorP/SprF family membrane protein
MSLLRYIWVMGLCVAYTTHACYAQDPHLSQFFSAPHFNNPALTGTQFGDWAVMGNVRQQWGNASTPFNTQVLAADIKLLNHRHGPGFFALGVNMMNDQTMNGAFRSNYASLSLAYHRKLSVNHYIAAGFLGAYGHRRLDFRKLSASNQFTGRGFDLAIPNGETQLSPMKPFFSMASGILYTYKGYNGDLLMDIGYAGYDLNRPNQSFLNDETNLLNLRHVGYFNLQGYPASSDNLFCQISGIFHWQAVQNYFSVGGAVGYNLSADWEKMFLLGCWFREGDAIYPYVGYAIKNFQFGLNYDITISKQNLGPSNPRSLELSFVYTGLFPRSNYWDCPQKNKNVRFPDF